LENLESAFPYEGLDLRGVIFSKELNNLSIHSLDIDLYTKLRINGLRTCQLLPQIKYDNFLRIRSVLVTVFDEKTSISFMNFHCGKPPYIKMTIGGIVNLIFSSHEIENRNHLLLEWETCALAEIISNATMVFTLQAYSKNNEFCVTPINSIAKKKHFIEIIKAQYGPNLFFNQKKNICIYRSDGLTLILKHCTAKTYVPEDLTKANKINEILFMANLSMNPISLPKFK